MAIPDEFLYEYAVVRYVPRVDREEFVNIGLIMMCKRRRWLRGEIRLNEPRLRAFDPAVNMKSLAAQASVFTRTDVPASDIPVEERYRWLAAVKSAVLQVSPSHPGILCTPRPDSGTGTDLSGLLPDEGFVRLDTEFGRLFKELVLC